MAESCSSSCMEEKVEELIDGCISKSVWDKIHTDRFENATLEEIEAFLDPNSVPERWLDDLDPPNKKLKLSQVIQVKSSKSRFASVDEQQKFKSVTLGQKIPSLRMGQALYSLPTFNVDDQERIKDFNGSLCALV